MVAIWVVVWDSGGIREGRTEVDKCVGIGTTIRNRGEGSSTLSEWWNIWTIPREDSSPLGGSGIIA